MSEQQFGYADAGVVRRAMRSLASTRLTAKFFARILHRVDEPILRRSGGKRSFTSWLTGLPIVELTTTGARTGSPRTHPILGVPDGERLVLTASNFGQTSNPAWYYNLRAQPECRVTFQGRTQQMRAYEAEGAERERLWDRNLTVYPTWRHYERWASHRRIPVMVLEPTPETLGATVTPTRGAAPRPRPRNGCWRRAAP